MKETRHVDIRVTSNVGNVTTKATAQTKGLTKGLQGVQGAAAAATGGIRSMAAALMSSGIGGVALALGSLVGFLGKALSVSKDFTQEVSKLGAISGATGDDLKALERDAKRLGESTEWTASQVVGLQVEYSKLGFSKEEILGVTEATLNLASATGVDLAEAASFTGNLLRSFGKSAGDTAEVVDILSKATVTSALDMMNLQEAMKMVAPISKNLKVSLEDTTSMLGILADRGIKGTMAGTALRRTFIELTSQTGKSVPDALKLVADKMKVATSDTDKLNIATELVGKRFAGILQVLAENEQAIKDYSTVLDESTGASQEIAQKRLDNLNGDLTKLGSAWEGLMLSMAEGDGIIQTTGRNLIQGLTSMITDIKSFSKEAGIWWSATWETMTENADNFRKVIRGFFGRIEYGFKIMAAEAKLALADVPIIGSGIDKAAAEEDIKYFERMISWYGEISAEGLKGGESFMAKIIRKRIELESKEIELAALKAKEVMSEFVEGDPTTEDSELEAKKARVAKFLAALKKQEEDFEDTTEAEKLERRKLRHLAELEALELETTQKEELKKRIEDYYESLKRQKEAESFRSAQADYEKHLADRKKAEEDYQKQKFALQNQAIDSAASMFGEETAMAKALYALKTALMIKEMIMSAKKATAEAALNAAKTGQDGVAASGKALKTLNPFVIASTAVGVAALIASSIKAMKTTKKSAQALASTAGGSVGGGGSVTAAAIPDFNIIGRMSAGENAIASTVAEANAKPMKAYVVDKDIETAGQAARTANSISSL